MKVFVTGGTGFTGSQVVPLLLKHGYEVRCLFRPGSDRAVPLRGQPEIEWALGDVSDSRSLIASMQGTDALINIASLGFGHAELDPGRRQGRGNPACGLCQHDRHFHAVECREQEGPPGGGTCYPNEWTEIHDPAPDDDLRQPS